jgi:hypothetical protein
MSIDLPDSVHESVCSTSEATLLAAFAFYRHVPDREASLKEANGCHLSEVHSTAHPFAHPMG